MSCNCKMSFTSPLQKQSIESSSNVKNAPRLRLASLRNKPLLLNETNVFNSKQLTQTPSRQDTINKRLVKMIDCKPIDCHTKFILDLSKRRSKGAKLQHEYSSTHVQFEDGSNLKSTGHEIINFNECLSKKPKNQPHPLLDNSFSQEGFNRLEKQYCGHKQHDKAISNLISSSHSECTKFRKMAPVESFCNASKNAETLKKIIILILINVTLNHLSQNLNFNLKANVKRFQNFPNILSAMAAPTAEAFPECRSNGDCDDSSRICHEGKCICSRERPIEDGGMCLMFNIVGEACAINEQCLGNSLCQEGFCSCGNNSISLYNPSTKIYYCHPKRRLREECAHDAQCPNNSFCSTDKHGCLCQNGYGPVTVKNFDNIETIECLSKSCSATRDCESEYHTCEDNRCICLATHFDPHTAECYKFGSTGGKLVDNQTINGGATIKDSDDKKSFTSILKDLMKNSDNLWYVIIILALMTIILLTLMIMIVRKYYLGYCWTAHKKEYEPNNKTSPKSGYFNKDSINNKSFRQKKGEMDEDDDKDDTAAERLHLATNLNKNSSTLISCEEQRPLPSAASDNDKRNGGCVVDTKNRYVKVNTRGSSEDGDRLNSYEQADPASSYDQAYNLLSRPLSTSNSTAV